MMFKALLAISTILIATDYVLTGGVNLSACLTLGERFLHWLSAAGSDSVFSK